MAEGFEQPFPNPLANDLARLLGRTDTAALLALQETLPGAVQQGTPAAIERALEAMRLPETPREPVERIGRAVDRSNRVRFFRALGRRTRLSIVSEPGSLLTIPGRTGVAVVPASVEPSLAVARFVDDVLGRAQAVSGGIHPGVMEAVIRNVLVAGADPEALTRELLMEWERDGVPTLLPTGRTTRAGAPVLSTARAHASFIARDAIGTLQLEITRSRHQAAGIRRARWRTRGDSHVRPEHAARDGQEFSWDEGINGEFPGGPPACRCRAEAVLPSVEALRASLLGVT